MNSLVYSRFHFLYRHVRRAAAAVVLYYVTWTAKPIRVMIVDNCSIAMANCWNNCFAYGDDDVAPTVKGQIRFSSVVVDD